MFPKSKQEIGIKKVKLTEKDLREIKKIPNPTNYLNN